MQKQWLSFLTTLVLCATLILLPGMTASAESGGQAVSVGVSLVDHQGNETSRLAGGTVWAVVSLDNYDAGDTVQAASVLLDLGSNAVGLDKDKRCLTPYDGVEVSVTQTGKVLSILVIGSIPADQLTQNEGELCRVELTRTNTSANEDALLRVLERSGSVFTGVSRANDMSTTPAAVLAEGYAYAVGNGADPSSPGGTLINGFTNLGTTALKDYDWSFYKNTLLMSTALPNSKSRKAPDGYGEPTYDSAKNQWRIGIGSKEELTETSMTSKTSYDLSHGFTLTFNANRARLTGNFKYEYRDMLYAQIGDYTFTMKGAVTPQILYGGTTIAGADAKWTVEDLGTGTVTEDEGKTFKNPKFSDYDGYSNGVPTINETAASDYNKLPGSKKAAIEDNIKDQWTTTKLLSNMSFDISYDAAEKELTFILKVSSDIIQTLTCKNVSADSLRDVAITFGTQGSAGTCITVANPVLTVTGADYSVSEATCGTAGAWTASNSASKAIEAAHSFTCVAEHNGNRLYHCSDCDTYSYEQGTVVTGSQIPLTDCTVSLDSEIVFKTGNPITPGVTVSFGGLKLTPETDYTVAYRDNTEVGTATVTVTATEDSTYLKGWAETTFAIVLLGDVNGDVKINAADYALVKSHLLNSKELDEKQSAAADLNGDGVVNADDAAALWNKLLRIRKAG